MLKENNPLWKGAPQEPIISVGRFNHFSEGLGDMGRPRTLLGSGS